METFTTPASASPRLKAGWLGVVTLFIFSLVWRLPYAMARPFTYADELWYSLPTSERMARGEWLLYISGANYGAPIHEFFSSLMIRMFGVSVMSVRLPVVIIGACAVVFAYLVLRSVVKERVAFVLALLLAFSNSAITHYSAYSIPCYAVTLLFCGGIQLLTIRLARRPSMGTWAALAVLMGLAFYTFKISLIQSAVSLAWLWWRSENAALVRARASTPEGRRHCWRALLVLGLGAFFIAPTAYHFLTRRESFILAPWGTALLVIGGGILAVGVLFAWRLVVLPRPRDCAPALLCAAALLLIPLPAKIWYQRVEAPKKIAGGKVYTEIAYSLRHAHEWPNQARLIVQGVIPALILGEFDDLEGEPIEREALDWRAALGILVLGAVISLGCRRLWRACSHDPAGPLSRLAQLLGTADFMIIAPFVLTLLVMLPSWALHSERCFRYLVPFFAGGVLLVYRALEEPLGRHPRAALGMVALLVAYNAYDCYWHLY